MQKSKQITPTGKRKIMSKQSDSKKRIVIDEGKNHNINFSSSNLFYQSKLSPGLHNNSTPEKFPISWEFIS